MIKAGPGNNLAWPFLIIKGFLVMAGSGFLGLGGTGFGNFMTNIWDGAGDLIDDAGDIVASAPNRVRDYSDQLADIIYGGAQDAQDSEFSQGMRDQAGEFYSRQAGDRAGQGIYGIMRNPNAPMFLMLFLGFIAFIIYSKN